MVALLTRPTAKPRIDDGALPIELNRGQRRALASPARFTLMLTGVRSGKTFTGPAWLFNEMRFRGPGDYLVAAPSEKLLTAGAIKEFVRLFERKLRVGHYVGSPHNVFRFSRHRAAWFFGAMHDPTIDTNVYFRHASDPDTLEGATYKAAWLDECGQKRFKLESYEVIQDRLTIDRGRILMTTRPYYMGWLKRYVYDRWKAGDPAYNVVRMESQHNPQFPMEEWHRMRQTLPAWKFNLKYRGIFERPAGRIYDCFRSEEHTVDPFEIPRSWKRYVGLDFGGVNTAATLWAEEPNPDPRKSVLYCYGEYWPAAKGEVTARPAGAHVQALKKDEPGLPAKCVGGSKSEGQWRVEFAKAGYPVAAPLFSDVEVGIEKVYGLINTGRVKVFSSCVYLLEELEGYSRELDDEDNPTDTIEDKDAYHLLDSARYILGWRASSTPLRPSMFRAPKPETW